MLTRRTLGIGLAGVVGAAIVGRFLPPLPGPALVLAPIALGFALTAFLRPYAGLVLLTVAMVLSPDFVAGEVPGRDLTVRADDLLLGVVLLAWLARSALDRDLPLLRASPLAAPIGAYLLIALAATWRGVMLDWVYPLKAVFYLLKFVEFYLVYFMTVNVVRSERQARILLGVAVATAVATMVLGYGMMLRGEEVAAPLQGERTGERATYGGYFVLIIPVLLGLASSAAPGWTRLGALLLGIAAIPPVIFTQSRASYIGLGVALLLLGLLVRRGRWLVLPVACAAVALALLRPPEVVQRRYQETLGRPELGGVVIHAFGRDIRTDESTGERLMRYELILRAWLRHPVLGYGVSGPAAVESQYLAVLAETGVLGLAAYAWIFGRLMRIAGRVARDGHAPWSGVAAGLQAGCGGLLAHALTTNTFHIIRISEPFWLLAALVTRSPSPLRGEGGGEGCGHALDNVSRTR